MEKIVGMRNEPETQVKSTKQCGREQSEGLIKGDLYEKKKKIPVI